MSERYTVQGGLEHQPFERFGDNAKYALPLILLLIGLVMLGAQHFSASHRTAKPFDLGIYTVKTSGGQGSGSSSGSNNKNNSGNPLLSSAPSSNTGGGSNLQGSSSTTSATTGGMGGGLTSTSGADSGSSNISATLQTPSLSVDSLSVGSTTTTIDPGVPKL